MPERFLACANGRCARTFSPSRFWQVYCSRECRRVEEDRRRSAGVRLLRSVGGTTEGVTG